jgi:single-strand DNA-binding protein
MNGTKTEIRNKVQLMGSINKVPRIKTTSTGKKIAMFSIATTEFYYKGDEKVFNTQWHFAVAWGKVAEEIENSITPGTKVTVEGKLSNRNYVDKKGETRYITEVIVNEFEIVNKA